MVTFERQMELARLFLDGRISFEKIVRTRKRTKGHLAREICFGALCLAERKKDKRAASLYELYKQPGIGSIKAIKIYDQKFRR